MARRRNRVEIEQLPITQAISYRELVAVLLDVGRGLMEVHSCAVTAQLALKGQNADRDEQISRSIMFGVTEPVAREIQVLGRVISRLGGQDFDALH